MIDVMELDKIIALRKQLHQIPEASMQEVQTKKMLMLFLQENTDWMIVDRGSWFYAVRQADGEPTQSQTASISARNAIGDCVSSRYGCSLWCRWKAGALLRA